MARRAWELPASCICALHDITIGETHYISSFPVFSVNAPACARVKPTALGLSLIVTHAGVALHEADRPRCKGPFIDLTIQNYNHEYHHEYKLLQEHPGKTNQLM